MPNCWEFRCEILQVYLLVVTISNYCLLMKSLQTRSDFETLQPCELDRWPESIEKADMAEVNLCAKFGGHILTCCMVSWECVHLQTHTHTHRHTHTNNTDRPTHRWTTYDLDNNNKLDLMTQNNRKSCLTVPTKLCIVQILKSLSAVFSHVFLSLLLCCWLGDRKGIRPVKNPASAIPKGSRLEDFEAPGLTWSNLRKNSPFKQKPKVFQCYLWCWHILLVTV